jgi:hypothetical protein
MITFEYFAVLYNVYQMCSSLRFISIRNVVKTPRQTGEKRGQQGTGPISEMGVNE